MNKYSQHENANWANERIESTLDESLEKQKVRIKNECGTVGTLSALAVLIFYLKHLISWQFWLYAVVGSFLGATTGIIVFYILYPIVNKRGLLGNSALTINLAWWFAWAVQAILVFKGGDKVMIMLTNF